MIFCLKSHERTVVHTLKRLHIRKTGPIRCRGWTISEKQLTMHTPTWDIRLSLKKNVQLNRCCFQYLWEKQNHPVKVLFCNLRDLRENWGQNLSFGQKVRICSNEKKILYQFFQTRLFAFMTYGQFPPKSSSKLRFVLQDSKIRGLRGGAAEALEPLNLRPQISILSYI